MTRNRIRIFVFGLLFACGVLYAQSGGSQAQPATVTGTAQPSAQGNLPERAAASSQTGERQPAAAEEEEDNAQFKYSWAVKGLAAKTGLSKEAVYWLFFIINFAILAGFLIWVVRKFLPHGFAPRNAEIQKGIEEARKSSAEATVRLAEIESRLGKLDLEIAEIRAHAESDFVSEEQRINATAEQDAKHVVAAAEQEIDAAMRAAQRDLKAFAAGLAVDLAEKKIRVDDATDQDLVKKFGAQLGKVGR